MKSYLRYFVGFFITVGLIIILIILLFGGDKKAKETPKGPQTLQSLAATGGQVRMTVAGPIKANQDYYEVQVTASQNENKYQLINGYENRVKETRTYGSNQQSYSSFLQALSHAGYMLGDKSKLLSDDRGYCPLGQRYIFEIIQEGKSVQRYWASTCGKPKTYLGTTSLTRQLFENQIPDYNELISQIDF